MKGVLVNLTVHTSCICMLLCWVDCIFHLQYHWCLQNFDLGDSVNITQVKGHINSLAMGSWVMRTISSQLPWQQEICIREYIVLSFLQVRSLSVEKWRCLTWVFHFVFNYLISGTFRSIQINCLFSGIVCTHANQASGELQFNLVQL